MHLSFVATFLYKVSLAVCFQNHSQQTTSRWWEKPQRSEVFSWAVASTVLVSAAGMERLKKEGGKTFKGPKETKGREMSPQGWQRVERHLRSVCQRHLYLNRTIRITNTSWCRAFPRGNHEMIELERSKQSTKKAYGKINRKKTNKEKWPKSVFPRFWPSHRQSLWTLSRHKWIMECFSFSSPWRTHTHIHVKTTTQVTPLLTYLLH